MVNQRRHSGTAVGQTFFSALICCLLFVPESHAWNSTGHQVISDIAWRNMSPVAREKAFSLLKQHPHFERMLTPAETPGDAPQFAPRVFMLASTWPDQLRTGRGPDRQFHHPEWHYVNYPVVPEGVDKSKLDIPPIDEKFDPAKQPENILQALEWSVAQIKDAKTSDADKAVALAWLLHLVGDLHQPLHTVAMFSPDYPQGDRGGNLFTVKYHGSVTNLHAFWDSLLGGYTTFKLLAAITEKTIEAHPRDSVQKQLAATSFADWKSESLMVAREQAYGGGKLQGMSKSESVNDKTGAGIPPLPEEYDTKAKATARLRVALAGYRLANLLNELLK